jgi:hypothetical protein
LSVPAGNATWDVFVRDRASGTTELVSQTFAGAATNGASMWPAISEDGRFVVFESGASNLTSGDLGGHIDVFRVDRSNQEVLRLSLNYVGLSANSDSLHPVISADGRWTVFESYASDLIANDANLTSEDVFVHDVTLMQPAPYCAGKQHSEGCTPFVSYTGAPSMTQAAAFDVRGVSIKRNANGILFYGAAAQFAPFMGGTLCVEPPIQRTPVQGSGGNNLPCSGHFDFDFNHWVQLGNDPSLHAGSVVYAQYWFRDPQDATGFLVGFTDALRFTILP